VSKQISVTGTKTSGQTGFSILEVMIGIFIFVVGLLALSALQGALTRSMADAKVRTTATNIAERILESQRGFTRLQSDTATPKTFFAYNDIADEITSEPIDGVTYSINMNVTDYYYQLGSDSFATTAPSGAASSTYKQVQVTVTWDAAQNFRATEGTDITSADLGSGNIVLTAAIPALVTSASARVADESVDNTAVAPPVTYTPGLNPDIVSLELGDNKFKESLLPEPDVIRADELVETRFDVITYSQTGSGAQFLRREEFAAVSCECTLKAADATVTAHRPVIWAGDEYARGQHAVKPYGVSASNTQSSLCDACCRDHHDGGTASDPADHADTAVNTFVPFKPSSEFFTSGTFSGDHKHYSRPRTGPPAEVTSANNDYVEACRMVRVDGFFRVAQDFRREDLNIFPKDFLDSSNEIDLYSEYVTGAAGSYAEAAISDYETDPPCIGASPCAIAGPPKQADYDAVIATDGDGNPEELPSWTNLPFFTETTQQLRSRGVYIDYLSSDLRWVLENCDPATDDADSDNCQQGDVILDRTGSVNTLELVPFFDVQMTKLNRWNETPTPNVPVDTTNEPLADLNTHSRGVISKSTDGSSTVVASGQRGNLGFTDTLPIDPIYDSQQTSADIYVHAGTPVTPPSGITVSGSLTETVPGNPNITVTGLNGVQCGQTTASYSCFIPDGTVNGRLVLNGYGKNNTNRWACSTGTSLAGDAVNTVTNGANAKATFNLSGVAAGTDYNFVIEEADTNPCTA
jgi:Tfp pilus assembly protein PilV